jgi:hypothetical protein
MPINDWFKQKESLGFRPFAEFYIMLSNNATNSDHITPLPKNFLVIHNIEP